MNLRSRTLSGISHPFGWLSQTRGQVTHVLLTRLPRYLGGKIPPFPHDLHGLGAPLAFALSQDQTLRENLSRLNPATLKCSWTGRKFQNL